MAAHCLGKWALLKTNNFGFLFFYFFEKKIIFVLVVLFWKILLLKLGKMLPLVFLPFLVYNTAVYQIKNKQPESLKPYKKKS